MKNIAHLSNESLHLLAVSAASNERSATLVLLDHLAEIDRRRMHAAMGYSSLWQYVCQALGYSESQAFERISAMRLMIKVPEIKVALEAGNISLTTTAKLASHVRREKTEPIETLSLLKSITGKSSREVDRVLACESSTDLVARPDQLKPISEETTRITIDVDQEFLELMNRVRELKGHPGSSNQEVFRLAMKSLVKRHEVKSVVQEVAKPPMQTTHQNSSPHTIPHTTLFGAPQVSSASPSPSSGADSRYISVVTKNKIRLRSGDQCEFIDPTSKKRCDCKTKLEFDHIIPYLLGGQTTFVNLRHYCSAHNQLSAIRQFGLSHMDPFLKN